MGVLADLAADTCHERSAEGIHIELALAAMLFEFRVDVIADVVTGQELDAV